MQIERVPTANGIHDIKLIGENEDERLFIKQLAAAGTLSCMSREVADTVLFRPISVMSDISSYISTKNAIGKYDFIIRQNESHKFELAFNTDDSPIDLTQYPIIKLQVKKTKSTSSIIDLSLGSGLTIVGSNNNRLEVSLTASQTRLLNCENYYYDVLMSKPTSNVYYVEGVITVKKSTTR